MSEVEQKIISHLQQVVSESGQSQAIDSNTDLLGLGLLDSIGLVGLIAFVEEQFGIPLADDDIAPELFETPQTIAHFVEAKRS